MIWRKIYIGLAGCLSLLLFSSCIDDHFTDCARLSILYYIQQSDGDGAFSDTMSELDMSFYYAGNSRLAYRRFVPEEEMPADHIYRPVLPTERFDHLAIANFTPSSLAARGKDHRDYRIFHPEGADTIDVIETDVYVARKQLSVTHKEELIKVCLAPCVGKVRLHLNYDNAPGVLSTECFVGGIGSGFICYDSLFVHDRKLTMRMRDAGTDEHNLVMYESTSFPSRDRVVAASRNGVRSEDLWQLDAITKLEDKWIRTTVKFQSPLRAGECLDIYGVVNPGGDITIDALSLDVSISVSLEWKKGDDIEIEI